MRFLRVRGWHPEEKDRDRQFIVEAVNGTPIAAEGRLYAMTRDGSGTYSVYDVRRGIFVFGGQDEGRVRQIVGAPGFRERAEKCRRAMIQNCHEEKRMERRVREEYEQRGKQDEGLRKVWKVACKPYATQEDMICLERL